MGILNDLKLDYRTGGIAQKLIFWNVGLFVIPLIVFSILRLSGVELPALDWTRNSTQNLFSLSSHPADLAWKPWTLITYAFLHAGVLHLLFNMLWLYFASRMFLTFFTQKQLFGVYILGAVFAGLVFIVAYTFVPLVAGYRVPMVGASASIMAILVATSSYSPYYPVRMPLIGTIKLWHIAAVFIILDLIYVSVENVGGHFAHLAGALLGYLFTVSLTKVGTDISRWVSKPIELVENLFKPKKKSPFKVHRNPRANTETPKRNTVSKSKDVTQQQIDDILDKISKSGYDSLTKEEKEFLFKVGK